jgi:hypothetical protein
MCLMCLEQSSANKVAGTNIETQSRLTQHGKQYFNRLIKSFKTDLLILKIFSDTPHPMISPSHGITRYPTIPQWKLKTSFMVLAILYIGINESLLFLFIFKPC